MKKAVILFISAFLCLSSYGQSLRAIRDSLEIHYGFASVQSNDRGIWFIVGIPSDSDKKKMSDGKSLLYDSGYPAFWINGNLVPSEFKVGICNILGEEIIAPEYSIDCPVKSINLLKGKKVVNYHLPIRLPSDREDFFVLKDGTKINFDSKTAPPDEALNSEVSFIVASYLEDISDALEKQNGKYIGRKTDTLSVYSENGRIIAQFKDTSGCQRVTIGDDLFYLTSEHNERTFYDFTGKEIFPKGKYFAVDVCWFGYRVCKDKLHKGLISFDGKELIPCQFSSIETQGGHIKAHCHETSKDFFYTFDGRFICNEDNVLQGDGELHHDWKNCAVLRDSSHTNYAIIDAFGDYILPFTNCSEILYKNGSYRIHQEVENGNFKTYELGINRYGRIIGEAHQINKFGYHLLNGVLGFATGLAVVATAGTALIGGIAPDTSYPVDNNSQYVQAGAYSGVGSAQRTTLSQTAPRDKIYGSDFQNYERAYDGYASTLSKMYYGQHLYSDSERSNIQREMRNIREKVNGQNQRRKIAQSSWETWNGLSKYLKY